MPRKHRTTEYDVRYLDEFGDAQDVWHYDTEREAITAAREWTPTSDGIVAVVVERHDMLRNKPDDDSFDSIYSIRYMGGSANAIEAWGGTDED